MIHPKKWSTRLITSLCLMTVFFMTVENGLGYVLPAGQIIGFMADRFSKFRSMMILQTVQPESDHTPDETSSFNQRIWIRSPDMVRVQGADPGDQRGDGMNRLFRRLLIANGEADLESLLAGMGIDLQMVAFMRYHGSVAYCIGERDPDRPKILIDKERFLPLLLVYRPPTGPSSPLIEVIFRDYRELEQGWYPFEIVYREGGSDPWVHRIERVEVNGAFDPSWFDRTGSGTGEKIEDGDDASEQERLRKIIETFEKKYGD